VASQPVIEALVFSRPGLLGHRVEDCRDKVERNAQPDQGHFFPSFFLIGAVRVNENANSLLFSVIHARHNPGDRKTTH